MRRFARLVFSTIVWPGVKSVTVPVLSVIVVVVSVVPLLPSQSWSRRWMFVRTRLNP